MNDCIGFFDSGVGGLSVMHAARRLLPRENFFYYGDSGNAPYGPRPVDEIRALCEAGFQRILDHGVKAIVIACNTATAAYMDELAAQVDVPVIGTEPALREAQAARRDGEILAMATRATLNSRAFQRLLNQYGDHVIPLAGEGLVELVESGNARGPEAESALRGLLGPYQARRIDGIVLGCTHYPFLSDALRALFPEAEFFDGGIQTSRKLCAALDARGLRNASAAGTTEYATSGGGETLKLMHRLMASLDASNC